MSKTAIFPFPTLMILDVMVPLLRLSDKKNPQNLFFSGRTTPEYQKVLFTERKSKTATCTY